MIPTYHLYSTIKELQEALSRDFKSPVYKILKLIQSIKDSGEISESNYDELIYSCEYLNLLTNSLITYARIGSLDFPREVSSLQEILNKVKRIFNNTEEIKINIDKDVEVVLCESQFKTILYNIIYFLRSKNLETNKEIKIELKDSILIIEDYGRPLNNNEIKDLFSFPNINDKEQFNPFKLYTPIMKKTLEIHDISFNIIPNKKIGNVIELNLIKRIV